jgi:bacterioferritin (cytochrome b1)
MKTKELQEKLVAGMKAWQKIENDSVEMAARISNQTDNPVIRTVMSIIMQDSSTHHRVQQLMVDSLEKEAISLQPEELGEIWGMIEEHIALERRTIEFAQAALENIKGTKMVVQQYLLEYMLIDEEKHNKILDNLEAVKKGMYPYA